MERGVRWLVRGVCALLVMASAVSFGADLRGVRARGVLRHLGVPYANFVTGAGDGMDVELMQGFARYLGVRYEYVRTDWKSVVPDLCGKKVRPRGGEADIVGTAPVRGDVVANGFTVLPWREKVVDFSIPTFPSQIWLMARAGSKVKPIRPSGSVSADIREVREKLRGYRVLALKNTCLDPSLYDLSTTGAQVVCFGGNLNELAPAIINGEAELTILDVPDALIALQKWPGKIKVIGPVSGEQRMGVAFAKDAPALREAFNAYLRHSFRDGSYDRLIEKYYPAVRSYFPAFFKER